MNLGQGRELNGFPLIPIEAESPEGNRSVALVPAIEEDVPENEAFHNARLIAAAPDLLAAAEWVDRYTTDMLRRGLTEIPDPAIQALHDAIALATT